jgi:capsular polysaccharide biosynthesis protein
MICDRLKQTDEICYINLREMGSLCDFEFGSSPEGSNSVNFLEDNKTYVIMDSKSNYHHFFVNLMMPALIVLEELGHENLHFVLCNLNLRPKGENFDDLLVELLQERKISYTEIDNSEVEYINAKNFIPINGADIENGIASLYNYLIDKYNIATETPNKKIYLSRKNYPSNDIRIDDEEALENYFIEKGFEVIYPESIPTFKEQFELFNSCSTLAGLSGSGLTSLIFMQENQEVIEIVSRLIVGTNFADDGTITLDYGTHDHYKEFCLLKNHKYLSVQNLERQADLVKADLDEHIFSSSENS